MKSLPGFDPLASEIEAIGSGPALDARALLFGELEKVFYRAQRDRAFPHWTPELLRDRRRPDIVFDDQAAKPAAVLMALIGHAELEMIFTRRTSHLSAHAGQISLPGGRREPSDSDASATALREAQEEIGLSASRVRVLGNLPDYLTVTGFRVSPVIGWAAETGLLKPDPNEVDDVFTVPLHFLMNPAHHQLRVVPADRSPTGEQIRFYAMSYRHEGHGEERFIWGATAAIVRNFYHYLSAALSQMNSGLRAL